LENTCFSSEQRQLLWLLALESIQHGLIFDTHMASDNSHISRDNTMLPAAVKENRACFVTLKIEQALRGCIGTLQAKEPLIKNIISNAYSAAFRDPRFPPLDTTELLGLSIHLSILNPSEPLTIIDEQDLLAQLRPSVDGLVLHDSEKCLNATFLPSVWAQLKDPAEFLRRLKTKAGLSPHYWSSTLTFERYTVESFGQVVEPKDIA
jgi:uncharacterized protein